MSFALTLMPMVVIFTTFLFVLLIVLITKAPKTGAWLVGGLVFLAPVLLWMGLRAGMLSDAKALPLIIMPTTFLFVLLIVLLTKAPKAGGGLVAALVAVAVVGFFVPIAVSHCRVSHNPPRAHARRQAVSELGSMAVNGEFERVFEEYVQAPSTGMPVLPSPPAPRAIPAPAPIWSEGVEQEFEADVYPSDVAAARALGRRAAKSIRKVAGDPNASIEVVLFQEGNDRSLMTAFARAMEKELPGVEYSIEADLRNIRTGEVGLTLRREGRIQQELRHNEGTSLAIVQSIEGGRLVATAFTEDGRASVEADYIDKPWVEGFAVFAGARPNESFIVARSLGTCTSESEARQQALDDARARLSEALGRQSGRRLAGLPEPAIRTMDVERGGFIQDSFVQSFDGSAGRIWRQALLIDVSGPKLARLADVKAREMRAMEMSWARMGLSVVGVLVLIGVIYFFLNMATMGYYEWSLRIAGVVLAIVAIVSILMIVR